LTSPRFDELLSVVREKYDFVIVDSPPLLAVTDPSVVAARVDGVVLVLRLTKESRQSSMRASEMLGSLGAEVLGVVVNAVGKDSGYGGYSRYGRYRYGGSGYGGSGGYGYGGYTTGYGYGYGVGDETGNGSYYSGDEAAEARSGRSAARAGENLSAKKSGP
jgi:Mrp family chromosome partitioning ATPase